MSEKRSTVLFLLILPFFLYIFMASFMPLLEPDESRYSDIPSLMNQTNDYVTPRLHHVIYLEKPPLAYWATALIFKIFGESNLSSRLFVALCAWGCLLLAYWMGNRLADKKTGLYAAGVLSTFLFHFLLGKINILDMPLTMFVCLSAWLGYVYLSDSPRKKIWLYLVYLASALAVLTKGLIGIVFPFSILALWLILDKRWRDIPKLISPVGILIFLAATVPWMALAQKANSEFLWFFFVQEHFLRYTTTMHGKDNIFLFYFPVVLLGTLPWSAFLWQTVREGQVGWRLLFSRSAYRFLLVWIIFILLFYSVSSSKLVPYIGPVFLPLAVIFARVFRLAEDRFEISSTPNRWIYQIPIMLQAVLFMAILFAPPLLKSTEISPKLVMTHSESWFYLIGLPLVALISMTFLPGWLRRKKKGNWFLTIYFLSALLFSSLIFPARDFLTPYKSAYPVAQAVQKLLPPGQELYQFRIALYGIDFYNKIRTPIVDDFGELGFGISKLSEAERKHYFLSSAQFYDLCRIKKEVYCITKYRERLQELKKELPNSEILWDNDSFFFVRLRA